jgi:hypothetical protein
MGFNNCYLPDINKMKEYFESVDLETFVNRFRNYDSWTGSSDSFDFLEQKINEYENYKQTNITTNNNPNRM